LLLFSLSLGLRSDAIQDLFMIMKQLQPVYIVGAGGFGREVFAWTQHHPLVDEEWTIAGFIDDNHEALANYNYPVRVVSNLEGCLNMDFPRSLMLLAIGDPKIRRRLALRLAEAGHEWMSLVHPSAVIGENVQLGKGCIVCPHCMLSCDITLGNGVIVNAHSSIGHDVVVGDWTTISGHCELTGCCAVGEAAFFGCGSHVLPHVNIGDGAHVGAGSIVLQAVPPNTRVFGNPARSI
jgi:sugar O-acyltransferase (sialic acid O-acetyltransferase NeuD family)